MPDLLTFARPEVALFVLDGLARAGGYVLRVVVVLLPIELFKFAEIFKVDLFNYLPSLSSLIHVMAKCWQVFSILSNGLLFWETLYYHN